MFQQSKIEDKDKLIDYLRIKIEEKDKLIESLTSKLESKLNDRIEDKNKEITSKDVQIAEKDMRIAEKDMQIKLLASTAKILRDLLYEHHIYVPDLLCQVMDTVIEYENESEYD